MDLQLVENIEQYVRENRYATNTKLYSFLALMNAYIPESYLLISECQKVLGPPDPIHGGPPFEERMGPFNNFINTSRSKHSTIVTIDPVFTQRAVELLADLGITRSTTVKDLISSLCVDQPQPHTIQFIKDLLTKRELGENGKEQFSRLIEDIKQLEIFRYAVSVLKTASDTFTTNCNFPQTLARLYRTRGIINDSEAEEWAKTAISRAPNNSYVADTLGQIYKNRLIREPKPLKNILNRATEAFEAFKDVEKKAEREEGPGMEDTAGVVSISESFNNRGLFGFIQVAKIAFEKLNHSHDHRTRSFIQNLQTEVEEKFEFFEWYLTYSKPDKTTLEPQYFWKDVVLCYEQYTTNSVAESTSFPGLLDRLNRGRFTSKGRRAGFDEFEEPVSNLEYIRDNLKTTYEANDDDDTIAERYILSNVILSNKNHNSLQLTPVEELQTVMRRFLGTKDGHRSPEFYLLVLLLFWPEEQPHVVQEEGDEEVEEQASENDGTEDQTWEDEDNHEEQDTRAEAAQPSIFDLDLQQYTSFMESAFERTGYAKYLRGRYLLPLFFLGKGTGLSKWIHKSRLDAIVEREVDAELANGQETGMKKKLKQINEMWARGKVWHVPEIQDILLPVQVSYNEQQQVFVCAGGRKIMATEEAESEASVLGPVLFYLGFTIQGPVVFKVGLPPSSE